MQLGKLFSDVAVTSLIDIVLINNHRFEVVLERSDGTIDVSCIDHAILKSTDHYILALLKNMIPFENKFVITHHDREFFELCLLFQCNNSTECVTHYCN